MSESVFLVEDGLFIPTEHARGPWDPRALHGGAPAALITSVFEQMQPGAELRIGRLSFEFLRPIPMAPLKLTTRVIRAGRRVQELSAELYSEDQLICKAGALRVQQVLSDLPSSPASEVELRAMSRARPPTSRSMDRPRRASPRARWRCAGSTIRGRWARSRLDAPDNADPPRRATISTHAAGGRR